MRPVLAMHCLECHGPEKHKGGLRLDERDAMLRGGEAGRVVVPGKPDESLLIEAIRYQGDVQMPPKRKLKDEDVWRLTEWVKQGAIWPEARLKDRTGTRRRRRRARPRQSPAGATMRTVCPGSRSLVTPAGSELPHRQRSDVASGLVRRSIDSSSPNSKRTDSRLRRRADKATLIRRVSFDLTGLPPSPEEIDAFLRDDAPDAFEKLVDRLLASPHYGERWGRYWLDVARYGEDQAHAFQPRLYPGGYRYRDWLVHALNRDHAL